MFEDVPDSDEEMSIGHGSPSDLSAASSQAGSVASDAGSADISSAEVVSRPSPPDTEEGAPAAESNVAASREADSPVNGKQPAHATAIMAASMSQATRPLSHCSQGILAADQQLKAVVPADGGSHADRCKKDVNGVEAERAEIPAANPSQQLSNLQAPSKPCTATSCAALMPAAPLASAQASTHKSLLDCGVSEGVRKRKAATVFDQGIADQAEAADFYAGISAIDADDTGVNTSMSAQHSPKDGHTSGKVSTDLPDGARVSLSTMQTRKSQPRTAPWR